jgi:hypothetical protein
MGGINNMSIFEIEIIQIYIDPCTRRNLFLLKPKPSLNVQAEESDCELIFIKG